MTEIESVRPPHCILNEVGGKSVAFIRADVCVHSPIVGQQQLISQYRSTILKNRKDDNAITPLP